MYIDNTFGRDFIIMSVKTMIQISKDDLINETSISKELIADKISNVIVGLQKLSDISASLEEQDLLFRKKNVTFRILLIIYMLLTLIMKRILNGLLIKQKERLILNYTPLMI